MPTSYKRLLRKAKILSNIGMTVIQLRTRAKGLCNALHSDLKDVLLTDESLARSLVEAKFREGHVNDFSFHNDHVSRPDLDKVIGSTVIGVSPDAYNVSVILINKRVSIHMWKVAP